MVTAPPPPNDQALLGWEQIAPPHITASTLVSLQKKPVWAEGILNTATARFPLWKRESRRRSDNMAPTRKHTYSCAGGSDFPRKNALREIKKVTHLENRNCLKSA